MLWRYNMRCLTVLIVAVVVIEILLFVHDPDVSNKVIVVYSQEDTPWSYNQCYHGAKWPLGFGSCRQGTFAEFMSVVAAMAYSRDRGARGVEVAIDWWKTYFKQPMHASEDDTRVYYNGYWLPGRAGKYRSFTNYYFDADFPCPTARPSLADAQNLVQTLRLQDNVLAELEAYVRTHFASRHVIGVHYRGTDKLINGGQRPIQNYVLAAQAVKRNNSYIYVASDTEGVISAFEAKFPGKVLALDMFRASANATQGLHRSGLGPSTIHSGMTDMLRLSRCDFLIKGRSSLSDSSLLMRPGLQHMFI